jgi:murein DD-endopeptidase MepM/ murein hydrolase activator NlpD
VALLRSISVIGSRGPFGARILLAGAALAAAVVVPAVRIAEPPRPREAPPSAGAPAPAPAPQLVAPPATQLEIRRGESLPRVLARAGIDTRDRIAIAQALRSVADPRRLRPGERVDVEWDTGHRPGEVTLWRSPLERLHLSRQGDRWTARSVVTPADTRITAISGTLRDSLFASMEQLGEGPALTASLVGLFEWDFDFAAESLPGDRFRLLVEKRYAGDQFVEYGPILIAQYLSVDRPVMTAIAFPDGTGEPAYYDRGGRSVRKTFLRAPLDFTRITSGFSHARRHPVLGGLRPHLAVDYGAPVGTPVRAVADGTVVSARWNGGYGLSVVLRHARGYETMYNHLSRIAVRTGQRVSQRHVIGHVGSTGLSTGPHLDYRVMKNGRFVNPLGERFVPGEPVAARRRPAFNAQLGSLLERLEREAPISPDQS